MSLIRSIQRFITDLTTPICGSLITEERGRGSMGDNDDFRIIVRWKGKVRKIILWKKKSGNEYRKIIKFKPISRTAIVFVKYIDAAGGFSNSTKEFRLSKKSKRVLKYLNGRQILLN